jgi:hypothetical protein
LFPDKRIAIFLFKIQMCKEIRMKSQKWMIFILFFNSIILLGASNLYAVVANIGVTSDEIQIIDSKTIECKQGTSLEFHNTGTQLIDHWWYKDGNLVASGYADAYVTLKFDEPGKFVIKCKVYQNLWTVQDSFDTVTVNVTKKDATLLGDDPERDFQIIYTDDSKMPIEDILLNVPINESTDYYVLNMGLNPKTHGILSVIRERINKDDIPNLPSSLKTNNANANTYCYTFILARADALWQKTHNPSLRKINGSTGMDVE